MTAENDVRYSLIAGIGLRFRLFGLCLHPLVSALPPRLANDATEVHRYEPGILVCKDICFYVTQCRLWLVINTVIKGLSNLFLQVSRTRELSGYRADLFL